MSRILWKIAGFLWIIGGVFQFAANNPAMGVMYFCIGFMNIALGMAQAS